MKAWTVLVYLAGDNGRYLSSLEGEGVSDLLEMKQVGSSDAVDVVAQFDSMSDGGSRRYYLSKGSDLHADVVQDLGETNSGDAQVLLDFVAWGVHTFPAERYMLVLWNHGSGWKDDDIYAPYRALQRRSDLLPRTPPHIAGRRVSRALFRPTVERIVEEEANQLVLARSARGVETLAASAGAVDAPAGWLGPVSGVTGQGDVLRAAQAARPRGICFDDASKDFLDCSDLSSVLDAIKALIGRKVDVLGMDACLMSMIEVAYQVRNGAQVMVASEDVEPGDGWPYRDVLATLHANPQISAGDLGKAITAHYVRAYDVGALTSLPITQSALDLAQAETAVAALDQLARGLLGKARQKGPRSAVGEARARAQKFADPDYVDLVDFVSLLAGQPGAQKMRHACEQFMATIAPGKPGSLVLASGHAGLTERNAHGLSVYFPLLRMSPFYSALAMSRDCAWARFLDAYLG